MTTDSFFADLSNLQPTTEALLARAHKEHALSTINAGLHDICADLSIPLSQCESLDPAQVAATFREMARAIEMRDELADEQERITAQATEEAEADHAADVAYYNRASVCG